ncbi:hypothetical protein OAO48_00085 [Alphaproteobacteria bacterium]|nr:hypothetical protein [Alphaproteobacteria bacterium]
MFGLGFIKGTALGLTGGLLIGLAIKEACKKINNRKNKNLDNDNNSEEDLSSN